LKKERLKTDFSRKNLTIQKLNFMDVKIQTWLLDIHQAIDEFFEFIGEKIDFKKYQSDLKTKKATERNLEIIGEAVTRILKLDPNFKIENARNIIGTRNRIIHSYDNISDEIIWTIISRELPKLKIEISKMLEL
jgi:uncharacterized protein with HEPN domain